MQIEKTIEIFNIDSKLRILKPDASSHGDFYLGFQSLAELGVERPYGWCVGLIIARIAEIMCNSADFGENWLHLADLGRQLRDKGAPSEYIRLHESICIWFLVRRYGYVDLGSADYLYSFRGAKRGQFLEIITSAMVDGDLFTSDFMSVVLWREYRQGFIRIRRVYGF